MGNTQKDALDNIGFKGKIEEFKESYSEELTYLIENKIRELRYKQIILAYFLRLKKIKKTLEKKKTKNLKVRFGTFERYLKDFIKKQNKFYEEKEYSKKIELSRCIKLNKDNYYFYITVLGEAQQKLKYSSKKQENIIKNNMALFIDKEKQELNFIGWEKGIQTQLGFFLRNKGIKLDSKEVRELPKDFFINLFDDSSIKIYKIELENTEISIGDEATIYSRAGEGKKYYKKFVESGIITKEGFDMYDLKKITFSYNEVGGYSIEFKKKKDYVKKIRASGCNMKILPRYIRNVVEKDCHWYSERDASKMLRILIYNGYLKLYDKSYNKALTRILQTPELINFLRLIPIKGYRCKKQGCGLAYRPINTKICLECEGENEEYIKYHKIHLYFKKIISKTGNSIKKGGFVQNYKTMRDNSFELETNPYIIRLKDKDENYAYILFNENGLTKEDIEKMKRYGLPFLILNFKGELEEEFGNMVSRNAEELFLSIILKDFNPLTKALKELSRNIYPIKIDAFKESLKQIKSSQESSPNDFEAIIFSFFNLIFPNCIKWGGPSVADGGCILNTYKNEYMVWDAKRYNLSSLLDYVRNNLKKKDLNYLKKINKNERVKKNGKLRYYLYVTSNTKKPEFMQIKDEFLQLVKGDKELNKIQLICINKRDIIKLAEFFKKNQQEIIGKRNKFLTIIRKGFSSNEGYFYFDTIKKELRELVKIKRITPLARELRK